MGYSSEQELFAWELGAQLGVEAFGTFFLVLTVAINATLNSVVTPIAVGTMLSAVVFAGGSVSGGHYNPSVTLAFLSSGHARRMPTWKAGLYSLVQIVSGVVAGVVSFALVGDTNTVQPAPGISLIQALLSEMVFTFVLVLTVLSVATTRSSKGNSYYGLCIGFAVLFGAITVGSIDGAAFNPAVALGMSVVDALRLDDARVQAFAKYVWVYIAGEVMGTLLASLFFRMMYERLEYVEEKTSLLPSYLTTPVETDD